MRATTLAAGGLACAGAAMTIAAFVAGGGDEAQPPAQQQAARAAAPDGLAVWTANGCGSCHTFEPAGSNGPIGPDLALSLQGKDRTYIERGIVAPDLDAAPAYGRGMMPDDYATRISPQDLRQLVDFIQAGVRAQ